MLGKSSSAVVILSFHRYLHSAINSESVAPLQIFEFLTGRWLFVPREGPTWTAEAYHLAHMLVIASEEFDIAYFRAGKHFDKYFNNDAKSNLMVT